MLRILRLFLVVTVLLSWGHPGQAVARTFLVAPTASVYPLSAAPGSRVQIKGQGFTPQNPIELHWDSAQSTIIAQGTAGADGAVVINVMVPPSGWSAGVHSFLLLDSRSGDTAAAAITVNAANRKAIFIYKTDLTTASGFKSLLDEYGIQTSLVQLDSISLSTSFSAYDLILVGTDTGSADTWGDAGKLLAILLSGKPVLGIGDGGHAFFGKFGLLIGYPHGTIGASDSAVAINAREPIFNEPYPVSMTSNQVSVLSSPGDVQEILLAQSDSRTYEFGAMPSALTYYHLVQSGRFFLWGFSSPVSEFTADGAKLFTNTAWYLIGILSRDTLVLTNLNRMGTIGFPTGDVSALQAKVTELVGLPASDINMSAVWRDLSLDGPDSVDRAYIAWTDANMHLAGPTNTLASAIDGYIEKLKRAAYPNLKYIILTGSHEVIPMKVRPADNSTEKDWGIPAGYLYDLAQSGTNGSYLTDTLYSDLSYYTDGWATDSELVPEMVASRLVETPAQITALIQTYISSDGTMSRYNMAAIGSNDFMDGAQAAAVAMGPTADTSLNQNGFVSSLVPTLLNSKHGVVYIAGHGDFNWMTTRKWDQGFQPGSTNDQGDTEELVSLPNAVIAAAGCHNGVNFTNMKYHDYDGTIAFGDFPERMANKQVGVYIGATGYTWISLSSTSKALSDVMFSERLTSLFIDRLLNHGATTAGKAFQAAAKQYVSERSSLNDADRRVLAITTFYGIPTYRFSSIYRVSGLKFGYSLKSFVPQIPLTVTPFGAPVVTNTQVSLTISNWSISPEGVVQIPGAVYTGDENYPILPVITADWNLPGNVSNISVSWDQAASQSTTVNNIIPNATVGKTVDPLNGSVFQQPQTIFPHDFYPQTVEFTSTTSSLGGSDTTLTLGIMPVQFNPDTGQTRIWTKLVFNLSYTTDSDAASVDSDGDGLPDYWEDTFGLKTDNGIGDDGPSGDPDQDQLTNQQEQQFGTNPLNPDTDLDGYADGQEIQHGWDPLDPGNPRQTYLPDLSR